MVPLQHRALPYPNFLAFVAARLSRSANHIIGKNYPVNKTDYIDILVQMCDTALWP